MEGGKEGETEYKRLSIKVPVARTPSLTPVH